MKKISKIILFNALLFFVFNNCKDNIFTGTKNIPQFVPSPSPVLPLELKVTGLTPSALWKSCLSVVLNGNQEDMVKIGCNKEENLVGKVVELKTTSKGCNNLRFMFEVTQTKGAAQTTCVRNTSLEFDRQFFVASDLRLIRSVPAKVKIQGSLNEIQMQGQRAQVENAKIIRVFFEDQTNSNLQKFLSSVKGASLAQIELARTKTGIDFNDFVVDINSKNIPVSIEGTNIQCEGQIAVELTSQALDPKPFVSSGCE
jgi:hypothetical protein